MANACSINGLIMTEVNLAIFMRLPNRQIKITVNISAYMVFEMLFVKLEGTKLIYMHPIL